MAKKILKKAQKGTTVKPTRDSTGYYRIKQSEQLLNKILI